MIYYSRTQTKALSNFCLHTYAYLKFPFNPQGLKPTKAQKDYDSMNMFIEESFCDQVGEGFKYAYNELLQTLASQQDQETQQFYLETLESTLYKEIQVNLGKLSMENEQVVLKINERVEDTVLFDRFQVHLGLSQSDSVINEFRKTTLKLGDVQIHTYLHDPIISSGPVIQIGAYIRTKQSIDFEVNPITESDCYHYVDYRTLPNYGFKPVQLKNVFSMAFFNRAKRQELIKQLLLGEEYRWIIADIDKSLQDKK